MNGIILIADPVAASRITLKVKLAAAAHAAVLVRDVPEAAQACARAMPDAIIVAESLPGGGVAGLRRAIGGLPGALFVPVIAICAPETRLAAIRDGADAVVERPLDEFMMLARLRSLLAARATTGDPMPSTSGMAEATPSWAGHDNNGPARLTLVAPDAVTALGWRRALAGRGQFTLQPQSAEDALASVAAGEGADLYLIAADLAQPGDGLRLLSELRSRPASCDAGFVIALASNRQALAPVALDLGAGDVLPLCLAQDCVAEEAVLRLSARLAAKRAADRHREAAERERRWALTDPLTGLANRRDALPRLERLAASGNLAVMLLDLDHFKAVNDRYGHPAGDAVLAGLAGRLAMTLPEDALIARIGGEEFLIAVAASSYADAIAGGEALRRAVSARPMILPRQLSGHAVDITMSVGLVWIPTGETERTDRLLIRADQALLAAKAQGRNRVVSAVLHHAA